MLDAVAVLLQQGQFAGAGRLLRPLYVRTRFESAGALRPIDVLEPGFPLIDRHNQRQERRWREPAAQMLRERHEGSELPFEALMEADLLLWYRLATDKEVPGGWYPRTLVYAESLGRLPLFARAKAHALFTRIAPALGVSDRAEFVRRFAEIPDDRCYPIGRVMGGRQAYARLLGVGPEE